MMSAGLPGARTGNVWCAELRHKVGMVAWGGAGSSMPLTIIRTTIFWFRSGRRGRMVERQAELESFIFLLGIFPVQANERHRAAPWQSDIRTESPAL